MCPWNQLLPVSKVRENIAPSGALWPISDTACESGRDNGYFSISATYCPEMALIAACDYLIVLCFDVIIATVLAV